MSLFSVRRLSFRSVFGIYALATTLSSSLYATTWTVNSNSGSYSGSGTTGSLSYAIWNAASGDTINLSSGLEISLNAGNPLPAIIQQNLTINGNGSTIDGNSIWSVFAIAPQASGGNVNINGFTLQHALSKGGNGGTGGGGGGAGGGGAFYVENGASVSIGSLSMNSCGAKGGSGGASSPPPDSGTSGLGGGGGGGGYSGGVGNSGSSGLGGGGGGGGHLGGGNASGGGSLAYTYGGAGGGQGQGINSDHGQNGGNSANGYIGGFYNSNGGGGGGAGIAANGENATDQITGPGAMGGIGLGTNNFGGGGSAGGSFSIYVDPPTCSGPGGNGIGAGGGGGAGAGGVGGAGGPSGGGGGGGGLNDFSGDGLVGVGGIGGFGAGNGSGGGVGGNGSGLGGAIFIQNGGTLTINGGVSFSGNYAQDPTGATDLGQDIFIRSSGTVIFNPGSGNTITVPHAIESDQGTGSSYGVDETGGGIQVNSGTVVLNGANSYTGGTSIASGATLQINGSILGAQNTSGTNLASGYVNNITDNGTIIFTPSSNFTYTGTISGAGSLLKNNGSLLTLANSNSYSGGTIISGSSGISLSAISQLGTGSLTLENGGTLFTTSTMTIPTLTTSSGGGILNVQSGDLTVNHLTGTGLLTLTSGSTGPLIYFSGGNSNTFTGGFSILGAQANIGTGYVFGSSGSAGPISISSSGNLAGDLLINGTVYGSTCSNNSNSYITIEGSGHLNLSGTFTNNLGGTLTTVSNGVLSASSAVNSGVILIESGSDLNLTSDIKNNSGGKITATNGTITGSSTCENYGTISLQPISGTTSGSSMNLVGVFTNEKGGTFTVGGYSSLTCSSFNNKGTLTGCGYINSITVSSYESSTVYTGCSTTPLTINGDFVAFSGSLISPSLDPESIATLIVNGNASLEGAVDLLLRPEAGCYPASQTYTLLTASDDFSGVFSNVEMGTLLLSPTLSYVLKGVDLIVERNSFVGFAKGANAQAVAELVDALFEEGDRPSGELACSALTRLFFAAALEISGALDEMQPSLFKGLTLSQENNAVKVRDTLSYRMQNILDQEHCLAISSQQSKDPSKNTCQKDEKAFHVWADGFGDILHQKSIFFAGSNQVGYQTKTGGVVVGIDSHFAEHFYAGALGAYTGSDTHWSENRGSGDIDTGYGGLYFSALSDMFYGNLSVIGGWSHFTGNRNINFPNQTITAKNSHGGSQILSHADTGINLGWSGFTIRPFDSFDYVAQSESSFTESGAGPFDLKVQKSNAILIRNELGAQFAGCFCLGSSKWTISPKISWVREVRVKGAGYTASPINADISFDVTGYFPDRSLVSPGVMVSGMMLKDLLSLDLYYNGEFGQKFSDHNYGGQIRFGF